MERTSRHNWWIGAVGAAIFIAGSLCARDASAQISLNGEWSPRYHEDFPDRIPGPELGDYTGLPISDGARLSADSWDASLARFLGSFFGLRLVPAKWHYLIPPTSPH